MRNCIAFVVLVLSVGLAPASLAEDIGQVKINFPHADLKSIASNGNHKASVGVNVDAVKANDSVLRGNVLGGPNSFFRKNLGIKF
jgi:hypothetical protein